jgi:hypothetical protein
MKIWRKKASNYNKLIKSNVFGGVIEAKRPANTDL